MKLSRLFTEEFYFLALHCLLCVPYVLVTDPPPSTHTSWPKVSYFKVCNRRAYIVRYLRGPSGRTYILGAISLIPAECYLVGILADGPQTKYIHWHHLACGLWACHFFIRMYFWAHRKYLIHTCHLIDAYCVIRLASLLLKDYLRCNKVCKNVLFY